jgi:hypothetical protein
MTILLHQRIEEEMHFIHISRRILKIKLSSVMNLGLEEEHDKPIIILMIVDASSRFNHIKERRLLYRGEIDDT